MSKGLECLKRILEATSDNGYLLADKLYLEETIYKAEKYDELVKNIEEQKQEEQKLGIELNVLVKALKNGFLLKGGENGLGCTWVDNVSNRMIVGLDQDCFIISSVFNYSKQKNDVKFVYFKDYKKTWRLK